MQTDTTKKQKDPACCTKGGPCLRVPGQWIWLLLGIAIIGVLVAKHIEKKDPSAIIVDDVKAPLAEMVGGSNTVSTATERVAEDQALPVLMDLGAARCPNCKRMTVILEDLKKTYAGKLDVTFIDVFENAELARKHKISLIPTQIFFDAAGEELFRHEGFYGKEDILAKWKELGVELAE